MRFLYQLIGWSENPSKHFIIPPKPYFSGQDCPEINIRRSASQQNNFKNFTWANSHTATFLQTLRSNDTPAQRICYLKLIFGRWLSFNPTSTMHIVDKFPCTHHFTAWKGFRLYRLKRLCVHSINSKSTF